MIIIDIDSLNSYCILRFAFFRNYAFVILVHYRLPVSMQSNSSNFLTNFMFQCMRAYRDYSKLQRINMKNKRQDIITKLTFPLVKWSSNNFVGCLNVRPWYSVHGHCIFPIIILFRKLLLRDNVIFYSILYKSWILPRVNETLKEW